MKPPPDLITPAEVGGGYAVDVKYGWFKASLIEILALGFNTRNFYR